MEYLTLYVCEFACTTVPAFIVYLAHKRLINGRSDVAAPSAVLATVFAAYLFVLFNTTGAGTLHDALRFGLDLNSHQMNLVPFANFSKDVEGHLLNILLFVPLGPLVPMFSGCRKGTLPVAATAIATSLAIEISQLLNSRITDIDDLLMNVAGALIGYCVLRFFNQKKENLSNKSTGTVIAAAMIAAAFLGRFLLYDEMGLAKVLFGF